MLLFFTIFFTSQISAIYSDVDEHNKYIDQLRKPDKEEFFKRIVRRIDGDVDLGHNREEAHIPDAELDKHSDYVKKVIDEEKAKFEKQGRKSYNFSHIDFTLEKKRRKRSANSDNGTTEANTEVSATIPVQTVYDSNKDLDPAKSPSDEKHDIRVKGLNPGRSTNSDDLNENLHNLTLLDKVKDNNESATTESSTTSAESTTGTISTESISTKVTRTEGSSTSTEGTSMVMKDSKNKTISDTGIVHNKLTTNSELVDTTNTSMTTTEAETSNEKNTVDTHIITVEKKSLRNETKQSSLESDQKNHEDTTKHGTQIKKEPKVTVPNKRTTEKFTFDLNTNIKVELKDNVAEKKVFKTAIDRELDNLDKVLDNKTKENVTKVLTVNMSTATDKNETNEIPRLLDLIVKKSTELRTELNDALPDKFAIEEWNLFRNTAIDELHENHDQFAFILKFMDRKEIHFNGTLLLNLIDKLITMKALNVTKNVRNVTFEKLSSLLDRMYTNYPDLKDLIDKSILARIVNEENNRKAKRTKKAKRSKKAKRHKKGKRSKKAKRVKHTKKTKVEDDANTLQIAQDVVKALRIGIDRDMMKNRNKNIRTKHIRNNVNVYGLYDNSDENAYEYNDNNNEEPYYVPVYNYHANNAYYNAYNKYGPNQGDSKVLKGNPKLIPVHSRDESDMSLEKYEYDRAFYKKPHFKDGKNNKASDRHDVFSILPQVIDKPHILPHYDYDYLFGKRDELPDYALRAGKVVTESDPEHKYLKNRIRDIRLAIYKYKEQNVDEKRDKNNDLKGWLGNSVEYYTKIGKEPYKATNEVKNIDYDYLGESFSDLRIEHLNAKKLLPLVKYKKEKNIEVEEKSEELKNKVKEVYPLLKKLVKIVEFEEDEEIEACIRVMGDLIQTDNEGLEQYDWLESTVNVQSAIEKILDLTSTAVTREIKQMHPSDLELLKYTTYLLSVSETVKSEPLDMRSTLPKSKKKGNRKVKPSYKDRVWLYRIPDPDLNYKFDYKNLRKFVEDLADNLYDLHDAIKHIAMVTSLRNQHWFDNLKSLYLRKPTRKQLLELVLHLATTRLFNLIEDTSKKGIEKDFLGYIHENQMEVSRIQDAFVFVLKVLDAAVDNKLIENY